MKKLILSIAVLVAFGAVYVQMTSASPIANLSDATAIFKWETTIHDFGTIKKNEPVEHEFTFINEGDLPLIISSAKASCGCTVAAYTKEPIAPGGEGKVTARYDAAKVGAFAKTVTVNANTADGAVVLNLKGEVTE